jgi:alkanesulfonate monooxygenase SsuD/methylene tetrahydromethanopterin reductase-like flavin-dependent oxidoreductase (luciferase family)
MVKSRKPVRELATATLDHLTQGRFGFNVVTSVSHRVAQNFGYDADLAHAERYEMAQEWMDAVTALWESWEPDALVLDEQAPLFADHTKVHPVNFEGKYFKTRGPLSTVPGPQRRPVIAQAGSSGPGRDLAARHAGMMLALANTPADTKEVRADMHRRLHEDRRDRRWPGPRPAPARPDPRWLRPRHLPREPAGLLSGSERGS